MARRRGLLAEFQHQQRLAQSRANAEHRAQMAAQAQALRLQAAQSRAVAAATRASETEQRRYEREMLAEHVESRRQEVEELNEDLAWQYAQIDGMLAATIDVDDWVDLEQLKRTAEHPPFPRWDLESPVPTPERIQVPPPPLAPQPEPVTGLFGRKRKAEEAQQRAAAAHQYAMQQWAAYRDSIPATQARLDEEHAATEQARVATLEAERKRYDEQCRLREQEVAEHNATVDALIAGVAYGAEDAIREYVGIVLANSVYPINFDVEHEATFDPTTAELQVRAIVPAPDSVPTIKAYRYVKASDEVTTTQLSKKDAADRYAGALQQVALRSLHEIFEADRHGVIQAISLQVGPQTKDPATGRETFIPLVAVTSSRDTFMEFDLAGVVPAATLQLLGAAISKNAIGLSAIDPAGVRRS